MFDEFYEYLQFEYQNWTWILIGMWKMFIGFDELLWDTVWIVFLLRQGAEDFVQSSSIPFYRLCFNHSFEKTK